MDYRIIYSNRRSLALQVTPEGKIIVRAPRGYPKSEIERVVASRSAWLEEKLEKVAARREKYPEPTPEELDELFEQARTRLPPKIAKYAAIMGLRPAGITITNAKTRFGSCSNKGRISFSCLLMRYPEEAIDYVVVHELAHLVHMNHSSDFYALVASVLPDYKARAALLKQ